MKKLLTLIFSLTILVNAQKKTISGFIKDSNGTFLENASIVLYAVEKDTSIIDFTFSNALGFYKFNVTNFKRTLLVESNYLGFQRSVKRIVNFDSTSKVLDFILLEQNFDLNEIIIAAKKEPISTKGDTTVYNLSTFKTGDEKNLEELLKKLPNIKVAPDGEILFKGTTIEKILLDGEELFSNNYTVISKNIGVSLLTSIEAIENYDDDPILSEARKSGKVILNLKLDKKAAKRNFGDINFELGYPNRFEISSNVFSLKSKVKFGYVTNLNNVGFDPLPDAEYRLGNKQNDRDMFISQNIGSNRNLVNSDLATINLLSPEKILTNKTLFQGLSFSVPIKNKIKLKAILYASADKRGFDKMQNTQYFTSELDQNVFFENSNNEKKAFPFSGQIQVDNFINSSTFLRILYTKTHISHYNNAAISAKNIFFEDELLKNLSTKQDINLTNINLSKKINKNVILEFKNYLENSSSKQNLEASSNRYRFSPLKSTDLNQKTNQSNLKIGLRQNAFFDISKVKIVQKIGYLYNFETQNISHYVNSTYTLRKKAYFTGFESRLNFKKIKTIFGASLIKTHYQTDKLQNSDARVFPLAMISCKKNNFNVNFLHTYSLSTPVLSNVSGDYFSDYQTFVKTQDSVFNSLQSINLVQFEKKFDALFSFLRSSMFYSKVYNGYSNQIQISPYFVFAVPIFINNQTSNASFENEFGQFYENISTHLRINLSLKYKEEWVGINNSLNISQITDKEAVISTSTKLNNKLGIETSSNFKKYKNSFDENIFETLLFSPVLTFRYNFSEIFQMKIVGEKYIWKNNASSSKATFIDIKSTLTPKKSKQSFEFYALNILNNKYLYFTGLTSNMQFNETYNLRPINFGVRIKHSFN